MLLSMYVHWRRVFCQILNKKIHLLLNNLEIKSATPKLNRCDPGQLQLNKRQRLGDCCSGRACALSCTYDLDDNLQQPAWFSWQPPTSIMLSMPQKYQNLKEHSLTLEIFLQSQARRFIRAPPCTHPLQNHCFRHQRLAQRGTTKFFPDNRDHQCLFAGTKAPLSMAPLSRERVRVFGAESRK